tara:strand:+ start:282 stop:1703 length:1422 start_codon:yes stop_codon:yes gene_type:complete
MANSFKLTGDYYVDAINGNDANNGTTPDTPFKTIGAAKTAIGSSTYKTIIVGTGVYNEQFVGGTNNQYGTIKADGNVIWDGTGIAYSPIYNVGQWYFYDIKFVNCNALFAVVTYYYRPRFYRCSFTDILYFFNGPASTYINWGSYLCEFHDCRFTNVGPISSGFYTRNIYFYRCIMFDTPWICTDGGGETVQSGNYNMKYFQCYFGRSDTSTQWTGLYNRLYGAAADGFIKDCYFDSNCYIRSVYNSATSQSIADYFTDNPTWLNGGTYLQSTGSYNMNISGSGTFDVAQSTLNAGNNSAIFDSNQQPAFSWLANQQPTTAYGWSGSSANILHTDGGATWTNITSSGDSLQISSSAYPTGSIVSAIADLGTIKPINTIRSSWTTQIANACAPAVYSSSLLSQYPTRYTFEMKYGDSSPPDSGYKIFCYNEVPYVSTNGSGSGDIGFLTASYSTIEARYLQFRITLRTDLTGSV